MAPVQTIKLQTNIPVVAEIKYLDYYVAKPSPKDPTKMMSEQWGFKGTFWVPDDHGHIMPVEGRVYVDEYQLVSSPVQLNMAVRKGERDGVPQFAWTQVGKIQLVKREDGRKRIVTLSRVGEPAAPQAAVSQMPSNYVPTPKAPVLFSHAASAAAPLPAATDEWAALEARYARCVEIAQRCWSPMDYEGGTLVAAAATLFIECNKEHLQTAVLAPPVHVPMNARAPSAGDPTEAQVTELRYLLNSGVFTTAERQEWLAKIYGATQASMAQDVERLKRIILTRTPLPVGAGPGKPSSFADVPAALERGDAADEDSLPF